MSATPGCRNAFALLVLALGVAMPVIAGASPACDAALAALQRQEDRAASAAGSGSAVSPRPLPAGLAAARKDAARACLGPGADGPSAAPARSSVRPPIGVPSAAAAVAPAPVPQGAAPVPPALPPLPMPRTLGACDATGCWTSDGERVQRVGPQWVGPRGPCTLQGAVLHCP